MKVRGTLVEPLGMIEKKKETLGLYKDTTIVFWGYLGFI